MVNHDPFSQLATLKYLHEYKYIEAGDDQFKMVIDMRPDDYAKRLEERYHVDLDTLRI